MNREDLTKAIARLHKEQASSVSVDNVFKVLKQLVEKREKAYAAIDWTPDGRIMYKCVKLVEKNEFYLIMYTAPEFYRGRFSKEIVLMNLRDFFDAYFEMFEHGVCKGVIINPATEMELILDAKYIDQIIEK